MTSLVDALCANYRQQVALPWEPNLAGPQRVWFAVYPPAAERRLRLRLPMFEEATRAHRKRWAALDLTPTVSTWLARHEYRDLYFEHPERLELGLKRFEDWLAQEVRRFLTRSEVGDDTVCAIHGTGSLFGLASVSKLVTNVAPSIRGRLVVFFPGEAEAGLFRLLGANGGYDYRAVLITPETGES